MLELLNNRVLPIYLGLHVINTSTRPSEEAHELIDIFDEKYNQGACPLWVGMLIAKIYKAKSMLVCLETPLED